MERAAQNPFEKLRDSLIAAGMKFDEDSLKRVSYDDLLLAACGNAEGAICKLEMVNAEKKRRLDDHVGSPIERFRDVSDSYEMMHDLFCLRADRDNLWIAWETAPYWLRMYHTMSALRAALWFGLSGGAITPASDTRTASLEASLYHLLREQIPIAAKENSVPTGWIKAVEQNLDDIVYRKKSISLVVVGRTEFDLGSTEGFEGSTRELFSSLLTPDMQLKAAARFEYGHDLVVHQRYFGEPHPFESHEVKERMHRALSKSWGADYPLPGPQEIPGKGTQNK